MFCYDNVMKVLSVNVYKMCQPWSSTAMKIRIFILSEIFKVNLRLVYTEKSTRKISHSTPVVYKEVVGRNCIRESQDSSVNF